MPGKPTPAARRVPIGRASSLPRTVQEEPPFWLFRLETWLVISAIAVIFQIFPVLFWKLLYVVDVRNWTWGVWVGVEIAVIVTLFILRAWHNSD